jgi:hypothetical protein
LASTEAGTQPSESSRASQSSLVQLWLRAGKLFDRLCGGEWCQGRAAILFAGLFLLVRAPWLGTGYGAETDSFRVALSGLHLWKSGEYLPSRLPGYPVHDLLMSPLVRVGGSVATMTATAIAALVGVFIFSRITRELDLPSRGLLVAGFAFTPFLIVKSVETKDYLWALAFGLAAYLAAIRRCPALAGALLGVAIGCRITSSLLLLPLLLLFADRRAWKGAILFTVVAALTAFVVFLPVTAAYGPGFFTYADSRLSPDIIIRSIGQYSIGALGALAVLAALCLSWRRVVELPRLALRDVHVRIWLAAVALYVIAFLRLPIDIAYLIPIYPFGFLLLGRLLGRRSLAIVVAAILCSGLIDLDLSALHNFNPATVAATVRPCRSCAELLHDRHTRRLYTAYSEELARVEVPAHSVVLTGGVFPDFAVINWDRFEYKVIDRYRPSISMLSDDGSMWDNEHDVIYLASPDRPEVLAGLQNEGYRVYISEPEGPDWRASVRPAP